MKNASAKKLFAKSFVISLAVLAVMGALFLSDFKGDAKKEPTASSASKREFSPSAEDKFTLFVPVSRGYGQPPYKYFLLCFDGEGRKISVASLPRQTVLSEDGEDKVILGEVFERRGISAARDALQSFLGGRISAYVLFDNDSLREFVSLYEGTQLDVPQNLSQIDRERDIYIKIDKGKTLLSPSAFVDYISCTAFDGGINESLFESSRALAAFLSQNSAAIFSGEKREGEQLILEQTTTDISVVDFENRRELLEFLSALPSVAQAVEVCGELKNADTEFVLTSLSRAQISDMLRI